MEAGWFFSSHDAYFPIYSGKHKGEWNDCVDCHIQSSNYKIFSCINCHEHNNAQKWLKSMMKYRALSSKVWHVLVATQEVIKIKYASFVWMRTSCYV